MHEAEDQSQNVKKSEMRERMVGNCSEHLLLNVRKTGVIVTFSVVLLVIVGVLMVKEMKWLEVK